MGPGRGGGLLHPARAIRRKRLNSEKLIDYGKRWALLALGMFVAASGISLITQTHLGTTPISSLPYTITGLTGLTFGTTTFIVNVMFFVIEWLLLKKRGVFHAFRCRWSLCSARLSISR